VKTRFQKFAFHKSQLAPLRRGATGRDAGQHRGARGALGRVHASGRQGPREVGGGFLSVFFLINVLMIILPITCETQQAVASAWIYDYFAHHL
jgi:hypothetical protein